MDKVRVNDIEYDMAHRNTFEVWQNLNLGEVSLTALRTMERRIKNTLKNMHNQVHECRKELGLPARNWPNMEYRYPRQTKNSKKRISFRS